jgi:hypothetical protein
MIQAFSRNQAGLDGPGSEQLRTRSALHLVDLVEVDALSVPVDEQHDGEADADLGGGDGDDEQGEHLPDDVAV